MERSTLSLKGTYELRHSRRVIIFTEGGPGIGYGHISRCVALYAELINREISVDFFIHGDVSNIDVLDGVRYVNQPWYGQDFLTELITSDDFAIVDSYIGKKEIYETISQLSKRALFIDDVGRIDYPSGIIVNPSLDASGINYPKTASHTILTGPEYVIVRPPFVGVKRDKLNPLISRVLITMGGTDNRGLIPLLVERFCKYHPEIAFDVVLGSADQETFRSWYSDINNVEFFSNVSAEVMKDLMVNSDVAITAAGQTIYELLATQTPFIPIQVVDNQDNTIMALLRMNPGQIVLHHENQRLVEQLVRALEVYAGLDYREDHVGTYDGIVDGLGTQRIVQELLDMKNKSAEIKLRKVKAEDMQAVFDLSNKDYVRQYSLNKNKIEWDTHVRWFNTIIKDVNAVFYVVTDASDSFLGQIRYAVESYQATVSISLSEQLKGKGLSKALLRQSIDLLFKERHEVNEVIAFVSKDNIPSVKIFEGICFKLISQEADIMQLTLAREDYYANRSF